jgi:hypothetical protein
MLKQFDLSHYQSLNEFYNKVPVVPLQQSTTTQVPESAGFLS